MSLSHRDTYKQWPHLTEEEFELACAFFDQRYVQAKLGPTRQIFKIRSRRTLTTGKSHIEVLRLLQLPEDDSDLASAFERLSGGSDEKGEEMEVDEMEVDEEDEEELRKPPQSLKSSGREENAPPKYSVYSQQPYVTYEIHLHPTYRMPTLWFTLHDLPNGEAAFDLDAVYRYLVPPEYKAHLRAVGVVGGISAAPHPVTDVPAFFIHPCQTTEAMEGFDCPMEDYFMVWVGLVGGSVGLWIPPEMAMSEDQKMES